MSNKTITKFSIFVIFGAFSCAACSSSSSRELGFPQIDHTTSSYYPPQIIGSIKSEEITESSGLAASPCQTNVLWTHNDSGDGAFIYAIDRSGTNLGTWKVKNAENIDWEDMAAAKQSDGQCYLYIGEIGNTEKLERARHTIYRVIEPAVTLQDAGSRSDNARQTETAAILQFKYPDKTRDAETLLLHPKNGDIYVLSKERGSPSTIYKIKADFGNVTVVEAEKIGELAVPAVPNGFLTGGAISPDGMRVIVCDYSAAYELVLSSATSEFGTIWQQKPVVIDIGNRKQGEAVSYSTDGMSIFATSERRNAPLIEVRRRL